MPKYYCDYCETSLTHDSPSVRKTHNQGKKHKENVRCYYNQWIGDKAQHIIDMYIDQYKLTLKRNPNFLSSNSAQQTSVYVNPMVPAPLLPPPPGVPLPDGTTLPRPPMPPPGMPGAPPGGQVNPGYPMPMMWPPQPGQFMPPYPPPPMMPPHQGHMPPSMQPPSMMGYAQPMFNPVPPTG